MWERARDETGKVAAQLERSGIRAETVVKIDEPRFVILREAAKWLADLIFIRAHNYTNLSRWLLGSVAGAVLRDAPCSVEIVRSTVASAEQGAQKGMRILLGSDGSEFSLPAAQSVAARPWPVGTIVKLISVIEPLVYLSEHLMERKIGDSPMREVSAQAEAVLSDAGVSTTSEIVKGNPKEEIINQAKAWSADLTVVGSHGRRGLMRWLIGSVSEAVATHAPCSVEVIRTPNAGG